MKIMSIEEKCTVKEAKAKYYKNRYQALATDDPGNYPAITERRNIVQHTAMNRNADTRKKPGNYRESLGSNVNNENQITKKHQMNASRRLEETLQQHRDCLIAPPGETYGNRNNTPSSSQINREEENKLMDEILSDETATKKVLRALIQIIQGIVPEQNIAEFINGVIQQKDNEQGIQETGNQVMKKTTNGQQVQRDVLNTI